MKEPFLKKDSQLFATRSLKNSKEIFAFVQTLIQCQTFSNSDQRKCVQELRVSSSYVCGGSWIKWSFSRRNLLSKVHLKSNEIGIKCCRETIVPILHIYMYISRNNQFACRSFLLSYTVKNILYLCQKRSLLKFLCWIFNMSEC